MGNGIIGSFVSMIIKGGKYKEKDIYTDYEKKHNKRYVIKELSNGKKTKNKI